MSDQHKELILSYGVTQEQYNTADDIITSFNKFSVIDNQQIVVLFGPPQSGKTGVCQSLIYKMIALSKFSNLQHIKYIGVDVIIATSSKTLKEQTRERFVETVYHCKSFIKLLKVDVEIEVNVHTISDNKIDSNNSKNVEANERLHLIIVDESHMDANDESEDRSNTIDKVLTELNINMQQKYVDNKSTFLLLVTATPFEYLKTFQDMKYRWLVQLQCSKDYFGPQDLLNSPKILCTYDDKKLNFDATKDAISEWINNGRIDFAIVRYRSDDKEKLSNFCKKNDIKYSFYTTKRGDQRIQTLNKILNKPITKKEICFVLLGLGVGDSLNLDNVGLMFHTGTVNDATFIQRVGRSFRNLNDKNNQQHPLVYIPKSKEEKLKAYNKLCENPFDKDALSKFKTGNMSSNNSWNLVEQDFEEFDSVENMNRKIADLSDRHEISVLTSSKWFEEDIYEVLLAGLRRADGDKQKTYYKCSKPTPEQTKNFPKIIDKYEEFKRLNKIGKDFFLVKQQWEKNVEINVKETHNTANK